MPETFEIIMPETLEILLWFAALATWLMLLFVILRTALEPLFKRMRRLRDESFKVKVK
ncbi:hypothetical protein [Bradyrhizobium sp. CSS354]|uniref:hypothetical protein n=1 Tax=unclassified Bradyrhizobium TaxID=2631580 RepID=UPI0023AFB187|nr:hypothetical protein [Bradyrhizobium sp. CSS354]MDE5465664.1 hypothetical protein [Bradyrhizobium sp. CSS354]